VTQCRGFPRFIYLAVAFAVTTAKTATWISFVSQSMET
jgi:hypothetical protein